MVQDITNSKDLNFLYQQYQHNCIQNLNHLQVLVLSYLYWPLLLSLQEKKKSFSYKISPQILEVLDSFKQNYTIHKKDRFIEWCLFDLSTLLDEKINMNMVDLNLIFDHGQEKKLTNISIFDATVIEVFENEHQKYTLSDITKEIQTNEDQLVLESLQRWMERAILGFDHFHHAYYLLMDSKE